MLFSGYLQIFHSFIGHLRCFVANFLVLIFLGLFCICAILIAFSISAHLLLKKIKSCVFVLLLVYCLFIPPSRKNKVWIEYEGTRENIPQMFCTYIRIEWKILGFRKTAFHTFPKSVYPTPLLTLKQRLNGAQTQAVFLYFSILNSERKHLYLCPCKVSQIMMPFFYIYIKPHLVFFANEMMNSKQEKIV